MLSCLTFIEACTDFHIRKIRSSFYFSDLIINFVVEQVEAVLIQLTSDWVIA